MLLVRGMSLIAKILLLLELSVWRQLWHGKTQALPEHLIGPLYTGAPLEPLDKIRIKLI